MFSFFVLTNRCGNVAAILELDEHLQREFIIFEAAPQETRGIPSKKPVADYFLWSLWADSHDVWRSLVPFHTSRSSTLLLDGSVSLNSEQFDRKPAKPLRGSIEPQLEELDLCRTARAWQSSHCESKGRGGYWVHDCCHHQSFFLPSVSFHFHLLSCSLSPCRCYSLPPWLNLHHHCRFLSRRTLSLVLGVFGRS